MAGRTFWRAMAATVACLAGGPAASAPSAIFEPDPARPFEGSMSTVRVDGWPGLAGRGDPTAEFSNGRLVVNLNSECGFLCSGIGVQTFRIPLPAMPPGTHDAIIHSDPMNRHAPIETRVRVAGGDNYQGLWWASPAGVESGWGLQIAHQGNTIFATWYTYDRDGSPTWFVMPDVRRVSEGLYRGAAYRATARPSPAQFNLVPLESSVLEGTATFRFYDSDNASFEFEDGRAYYKNITRQLFSSDRTDCAYATTPPTTPNYQDLWWSAPANSESGWGVQIAHQGHTLFGTFFGYDTQGRGRWLAMPDGRETSPGVFAGDVYSTRGPAYDAIPWNPADVSVRNEGRATFVFTGHAAGSFTISGSSVSAQKAITRQEFSVYPTACH